MKMQRIPLQTAIAAAIITATALPLTASAGLLDCQTAVGFNGSGIATSGNGAGPLVNFWGDNRGFLSNNMTSSCQVKYVQPSAKAKPPSITLDLGPMTSEECSLYGYLSSIDSKLGQGKFADAYTVATNLVAKVDTIYSAGKISAAAYSGGIVGGVAVGGIKPASQAIQQCVQGLL